MPPRSAPYARSRIIGLSKLRPDVRNLHSRLHTENYPPSEHMLCRTLKLNSGEPRIAHGAKTKTHRTLGADVRAGRPVLRARVGLRRRAPVAQGVANRIRSQTKQTTSSRGLARWANARWTTLLTTPSVAGKTGSPGPAPRCSHQAGAGTPKVGLLYHVVQRGTRSNSSKFRLERYLRDALPLT